MTPVCARRPRRWRTALRLARLVLLIAPVFVLGACRRTPAAPAARAVSSWTVDVAVDASGDANVTETIDARMAGGATSFRRHVESAQADAFALVRAALDGQPLADNAAAPARVTATGGRTLDVVWTFPPAAGESAHEFVVSYRAVRAVEIDEDRGRIAWPALPAARGYPIDHSRLTLVIPSNAVMYDPSGIGERGWTVSRLPHGITAERANIAPAEGARILARFSVQPAVMTEPTWQLNADRATQFGPAFISAGVFLVVVGIGALWTVWFQYPRKPRRPADDIRSVAARAVERREIARDFTRAGWITLGTAAALACAAWLMVERYGTSPYAVPIGTVIDGALFFIAGRVFP